MDVIVQGVVRDGSVVTEALLPEGARVEIRLLPPIPEVSPELQAEFEAWGLASDRAMQLVDGEGSEDGADASR